MDPGPQEIQAIAFLCAHRAKPKRQYKQADQPAINVAEEETCLVLYLGLFSGNKTWFHF